MDTGGRTSCLTRGDVRSTGEAGWMEGSTMGRVLVREDEDEMEVVDIVEMIEGIEEVEIKSG